mgnify:CR=1 FL=1|tara:strand:- start:30936 stop:31817 length:882 start_codon:yes stop_codon:yes gene_type:complete
MSGLKNNSLNMTVGALTHKGMKREGNEDSFCVLIENKSPAYTSGLMVVADGMGGHQAGEVASLMAVDGVVNFFEDFFLKENDPFKKKIKYATSFLSKSIEKVNFDIYAASKKPETEGMGTTLTTLLFIENIAIIGHVGDSRIYLLRDNQFNQITVDHTWVEGEVKEGRLTADEAINHPMRNILSRAIGNNQKVKVDTDILNLKQDDIILFCSDGLNAMLDDLTIKDIISKNKPQQACDLLVNKANANGGLDNITVGVVNIDSLLEDSSNSDQLEEYKSKPKTLLGNVFGLLKK